MTPKQYLDLCCASTEPVFELPNPTQTEILATIKHISRDSTSGGAGHTLYVWRGVEARVPTATLNACERHGWITKTFERGYALTDLGEIVLTAALAQADWSAKQRKGKTR